MKQMVIDLTGKAFGRLTVIKRDGSDHRGQALWQCVCSCGRELSVRGTKLRREHTKSCGCLVTEMLKKRNTTHNKYGTVEHKVWRGMIRRCHCKSEPSYPRYGGNGITVCEEWRYDFDAFLAHIGSRPSPDHSIDRIKNERGYEPGNVRWATRVEQSRNRACVPFYEFGGRRAKLPEFAEIYGIPHRELYRRVSKGWSLERALTQPLRKSRSRAPLGRAALERAAS